MDGTKGKLANLNDLLDTHDPRETLGSAGVAQQAAHAQHAFDASASENSRRQAYRAPERVKQIWAIGGGKGGVGKSLIASSLAISLARSGNDVTAVDLDLGGANLHTTLGVDLPQRTLGDYLSQRAPDLADCTMQTSIPHLSLISGAQDAMTVPDLSAERKFGLIRNLRTLDTDYVIIDLGAGTSSATTDFYLAADIGIITALPEPTSIENAYRFIKTAYYRRLTFAKTLGEIQPLIEAAMDPKNSLGIRSPSDLFREANRVSPDAGMKLKREIEKYRPKLMINQARTQTDIDIGFSIKTVCKKYFGIEMDYVGYLDYDSAVWQAVRRKKPLMIEFPNSRLVSSVDRIVNYLLKRYNHARNDLFG